MEEPQGGPTAHARGCSRALTTAQFAKCPCPLGPAVGCYGLECVKTFPGNESVAMPSVMTGTPWTGTQRMPTEN